VTPLTLRRGLTVTLAAAQAGCSASLVLKAIRSGQLPAVQVGGRQLLIEADDLDRWATSRKAQR
jgi:excisionase family DNA binding protein